jgi:hypothetical protein
MKLDEPLKALFDRSVSQFAKLLPPSENALWDMAGDRANRYAVHAETRSIVFKWLENGWQPGTPAIVRDYDYAPRPLIQQAEAVAAKLAAHHRGKVVKLMLAELQPGCAITAHRDVSPALFMSHRCHLPIVSNPDVDFEVDGVNFHLEPGKVYELDNTRMHAVANRGQTTRVHLICDVMPA